MRLIKALALFFSTSASCHLIAQEVQLTDSIDNPLSPIQINAYFAKRPLLTLTSSAQSIGQDLIASQGNQTLLTAINTVPGIRMEERSPGSYRLAMRGSLIRSPFGIRNAKIYVDEFPLTDAGGNTYLNLLDPASVRGLHIIKGPDGSIYGPNSGGVIQLTPNGFDAHLSSSLAIQGGSFGGFQEQLSTALQPTPNYNFAIDQSFSRSDGYRQNSALNKKTIQTTHRWNYSPSGQLKLLALYANLGYRTPGGLTQAQYDEDPTSARPPAGLNPGAMEQRAGIYNKTFFGGLSNTYELSNYFTHVISLFGSLANVKNPFITNFEKRDENNIGLRSYISYHNEDNEQLQLQFQLGVEGQKGDYKIDNFDNEKGIATHTQNKNRLKNDQHFYFLRGQTLIAKKLTLEASLGLNYNAIKYEEIFPEATERFRKIDFGTTWMPRFGASYLLTHQIAARTSISKGFSAPTIAEIYPSDNEFNANLKPETGTNYEIGLRAESWNRRLIVDAAYYYFRMDDAIIRQIRESGKEYFLNAGKVDQQGIEASILTYLIAPRKQQFIQSLSLGSNMTYNHYRFAQYKVGQDDFSGNKLTATPDWIWVNHVSLTFDKNFGINIMHNFTSSIPLNDANTVYADKYHLLQAKINWTTPLVKGCNLQLFAGVDNLLNEKYSLGNDINAFGGRYFNAAPSRNYYIGFKLMH